MISSMLYLQLFTLTVPKNMCWFFISVFSYINYNMYIYIYIYIHEYTYMYIYMYTYICRAIPKGLATQRHFYLYTCMYI